MLQIIKDILENLENYKIDLEITNLNCDDMYDFDRLKNNYENMYLQLKNILRSYMQENGKLLDEKTIKDLNLEMFNNFNPNDKIYYILDKDDFLYFGSKFYNPYDIYEIFGIIKL